VSVASQRMFIVVVVVVVVVVYFVIDSVRKLLDIPEYYISKRIVIDINNTYKNRVL
jgi:uncharacterized protein HemY